MKEITILSTEVNPKAGLPFSSIGNNDSFAHLLRVGEQHGISMTMTHFDSYENGTVSEAWIYTAQGWRRTGRRPVEFIWDRCNIRNKEREKLNAHPTIDVFNPADLMILCRDKKANYDLAPEFVIPTETVNGSVDEIVAKIETIRKKQLHPDLNSDRIVLKPRYNYAGRGIFDIHGTDYEKLKDIEDKDYVIQPFLETSSGIPELEIKGRHDLRVIVLNGRPVRSYTRLIKKDKFICRADCVTGIPTVNMSELYENFMSIICRVDAKLKKFNPRMYSVDLGRGKDKRWVFEFNGFPSIIWKPGDEIDIKKTKEMHKSIIKTLVDYIQ